MSGESQILAKLEILSNQVAELNLKVERHLFDAEAHPHLTSGMTELERQQLTVLWESRTRLEGTIGFLKWVVPALASLSPIFAGTAAYLAAHHG
jgi:hypothetical protein